MSSELKIPDVGESIQEVQIGRWLKQEGDYVEQDETVVELETDKASMELPAPLAGTLASIVKHDGDLVTIGETIAYIDEQDERPQSSAQSADQAEADVSEPQETPSTREKQPTHASDDAATSRSIHAGATEESSLPVTPSGRRALRKYGVSAEDIQPQGRRIRREDVERFIEQNQTAEQVEDSTVAARHDTADPAGDGRHDHTPTGSAANELEQLVPMSLIRRRIAESLVQAQQKAALLTTFNQIDMSEVITLRRKYQDQFQKKYQVKLGFMSFFVKAAVDALKTCPELNAEIRERDILYRNYYHIGIAIGSGKGLIVPVLRHAERMSFAEIEQTIDDFATRAKKNKVGPDELQGGTFTISNGGIYGSLLSTPIVNPPQSGVLGMHAIEERPVARDGEVVIRPMMYIALTYDHRIVDGAEAVTFLKRIKQAVEEPARMLVEI